MADDPDGQSLPPLLHTRCVSQKLAAVVYGGAIWTSVDSGATWTERAVGGSTPRYWYSIASSSDGTVRGQAGLG
jgi:hypothetical protein